MLHPRNVIALTLFRQPPAKAQVLWERSVRCTRQMTWTTATRTGNAPRTRECARGFVCACRITGSRVVLCASSRHVFPSRRRALLCLRQGRTIWPSIAPPLLQAGLPPWNSAPVLWPWRCLVFSFTAPPSKACPQHAPIAQASFDFPALAATPTHAFIILTLYRTPHSTISGPLLCRTSTSYAKCGATSTRP